MYSRRKTMAGRYLGQISSSVLVIEILVFLVACMESAEAYIGPSFLEIPGLDGGWKGEKYQGWTRLEAHYWGENPPPSPPLYTGDTRLRFAGSQAPERGKGQLTVAIAKQSTAYTQMVKTCKDGEMLPEVSFAESSERARPPAELGLRPESVPANFEYTLKNVTMDCPEVEAAPEQALILKFTDIEGRNYTGGEVMLDGEPAVLPPAEISGHSRAYIVHWLWSANSVSPDQCPAMSEPPSEEEYYAFKTKEEIAARKAEFDPQGGVLATFTTGEVAKRGPRGINVSLLPGVVPYTVLPSPQIEIGHGLNLDGEVDDSDFVSTTGSKGIDNQLFRVDGCITGFGPKGILTVTTTEARRNGEISLVVLISGIEDEVQDDDVNVTLFYSKDPMVKSANGENILPGFTFRLSDDPERTPYFQRLSGRIVDGVVLTDVVDHINLDKGRDLTRLFGGRMRLKLNSDRTLTGVVAGYQDWRSVANYYGSLTFFETGMGYKMPEVYNALKKFADGLPDPVTGEYAGISTAFEIKGVEAYIPPEQKSRLLGAGQSDSQLGNAQ